MTTFTPFWESSRFKDATLSKIQQPPEISDKLLGWIKKDKNMLVFMGNPGVGKSYFCAAYIHMLQEKKQHFRYFSEADFFRKLRESISKGFDYEHDIQCICEAKYIIIDDIGTARGEQLSDFQKEALHILIDIRYNLQLPTLITSNLFIKDIYEKISPKIASRLSAKENTLIELDWIDKRQEIC